MPPRKRRARVAPPPAGPAPEDPAAGTGEGPSTSGQQPPGAGLEDVLRTVPLDVWASALRAAAAGSAKPFRELFLQPLRRASRGCREVVDSLVTSLVVDDVPQVLRNMRSPQQQQQHGSDEQRAEAKGKRRPPLPSLLPRFSQLRKLTCKSSGDDMASPTELVSELLSGLHALDPCLLAGVTALGLHLFDSMAGTCMGCLEEEGGRDVRIGSALSCALAASLPQLTVGHGCTGTFTGLCLCAQSV